MKLPARFGRAAAGSAGQGPWLKRLVLGALILALLGGAGLLAWRLQQAEKQRSQLLAEAERVGAMAESPQVLARCEAVVKALPEVLDVLATEPNTSAQIGQSRRALGQCHLKLKRYADAVREFRAAIELRPEFAPLHGDMAQALSRNGQHAQAKRWARLAVQLDPQVWVAHRTEARILDAAKAPQEAQRAYQEAIRLAPPDQVQAIEAELQRLLKKHEGESSDPPSTPPAPPSRRPPA